MVFEKKLREVAYFGLVDGNCVHSVSVAFSPVVTIALHCGIRCSRAGMSVGCTTSRNLSEALSCRRRMAEAVSNKAIPFPAGN